MTEQDLLNSADKLEDDEIYEQEERPTPPVRQATTTARKKSSYSLLEQNILQAHMALLDHEIISLHGKPEEYRQVRLHITTLEKWHEQHTGWRIQRGAAYFRLERRPYITNPVFTDEKLKKARDFTCLTWLLWYAEKRYLSGGARNQQFLISQLVEELQEETQGLLDTDKPLDFRNQYDRYSMGRAMDYLAQLGGIVTLEGETRKWVENASDPDNEVLYEFTPSAHSLVEGLDQRHILMTLQHLKNSTPTQPGRVSAIAEQLPPLTRAWRTLLLGPMLLRFDDPEAFERLTQQAEQVSDELSDAFGWLLELNQDYACIVRGGSLSSGSGPTLVTTSGMHHIVLMLCSAFRRQVENNIWQPDSYGCIAVSRWDIAQLFNELRQSYGSHWGTTIQAAKATDILEDVYQLMRQLGLIRGPDAQDTLLILPTAARYRIFYGQDEENKSKKARTRQRSKEKTAQPDTQTLF